MSIEFQNGFLCGMATKGMLRTGQQYEPKVWNDEGVYGYFYIDFKRSLLPFSTGMFGESVVVHDSEQLPVTGVEYVSPGVYKIYCNIAGKVSGITCVNKKTSWLKFSDGRKVPPFSIHFYVAGILPYLKVDYAYDTSNFLGLPPGSVLPSALDLLTWPAPEVAPALSYETCNSIVATQHSQLCADTAMLVLL